MDTGIPDLANCCGSNADRHHEKIWPGDFASKDPDMALLVDVIVHIVANSFDLDPQIIVQTRRGVAKVARARQILFYLLHTSLSFPLVEIAQIFGKDRTTIGHACRLIEDLRDEAEFDGFVSKLEKVTHLVARISGGKI